MTGCSYTIPSRSQQLQSCCRCPCHCPRLLRQSGLLLSCCISASKARWKLPCTRCHVLLDHQPGWLLALQGLIPCPCYHRLTERFGVRQHCPSAPVIEQTGHIHLQNHSLRFRRLRACQNSVGSCKGCSWCRRWWWYLSWGRDWIQWLRAQQPSRAQLRPHLRSSTGWCFLLIGVTG
jgi:hypothetical protein